MIKAKCPVCGLEMPKKSLIYHIRKKAVFEVYDAYVGPTDTSVIDICPHQTYIEENQTSESKFRI